MNLSDQMFFKATGTS